MQLISVLHCKHKKLIKMNTDQQYFIGFPQAWNQVCIINVLIWADHEGEVECTISVL